MQLQITGNIEITPAIKEYAESRMEHLTECFNTINKVHMVLNVEHQTHFAEATVHFDGIDFNASATDTDMYKAIEAMAAKLFSQVKKHKDKVIDSHHQE